MSPPWMPLYIADYIADTGHLSTEDHGAYLLLMMHYWRTGGLPTSDAELALIVRLPLKRWLCIRPKLNRLFRDGWRHKRIDAELERTAKVSEAYASRAKKAAFKRWSKDASSIASSTPQAILQNAEPQSQSHTEASASVESASRDAPREKPELNVVNAANGARAPRAARLPAEFSLSGEMFGFARGEGLDPGQIPREFARFRDYWAAASGANARKNDWLAAWRNWARKAADGLNRGGTQHAGKATKSVQDAAREQYERAVLAEFREAADADAPRLLPARGSG